MSHMQLTGWEFTAGGIAIVVAEPNVDLAKGIAETVLLGAPESAPKEVSAATINACRLKRGEGSIVSVAKHRAMRGQEG